MQTDEVIWMESGPSCSCRLSSTWVHHAAGELPPAWLCSIAREIVGDLIKLKADCAVAERLCACCLYHVYAFFLLFHWWSLRFHTALSLKPKQPKEGMK